MSGTATAEALVALHAAEAELEAALAAEKVPASELGSLPPVVPAVESVTAAGAALGPEQIAIAKEFLSRDPPPHPDAPQPPAPVSKWLVLPGYLGPIAINGT